MKRWPDRWVMITVCVALISVVLMTGSTQAQDTNTTAAITSPAEGAQLFGAVNIFGSAQHPTSFKNYTLEYDDLADPAVSWLLVQTRVSQQVNNNVLGNWNTIVVPDGVYQLRLRVFLQDDTVGSEFTVSQLRVMNSAPTPVPTAATGGAGGLQPTPSPGPSPTSPVQQPPSNNPPAESITGLNAEDTDPGSPADTSNTSGRNASSTRVNTGRIRSAFCSGVYLALIMFALMLGYIALRGRLRPMTRRLLWQIQDEFDERR